MIRVILLIKIPDRVFLIPMVHVGDGSYAFWLPIYMSVISVTGYCRLGTLVIAEKAKRGNKGIFAEQIM